MENKTFNDPTLNPSQLIFEPLEHAIQNLGSNIDVGLSDLQYDTNFQQYGPNKIPEKKPSVWKKYVKPLANPLLFILLICSLALLALGSSSGVTILAILALNAIIAVVQQYRAEKTLEALKKIADFKAKVLRNNIVSLKNADEIVPGDILILDTGDYIAADGRLITANNFSVNESSLTGESAAVTKTPEIPQNANVAKPKLHELTHMVFKSTFVVSGNAKVLVTATGQTTEIGKIAHILETMPEQEIPLQVKVTDLAKKIGLLIVFLCGFLLVFGIVTYLQNDVPLNAVNMLSLISWLVMMGTSAVPFNFPLLISVILLTGLYVLAKQNAIVKNLNAVESLGRISVICTDKTGTLTQNEMTIKDFNLNGIEFEVTGDGYFDIGDILLDSQKMTANQLELKFPAFSKFLINAAINNNAKLTPIKNNLYNIIGLPTEGALLIFCRKLGIIPETLLQKTGYTVMGEIAFSSDRKMMTKVLQSNGHPSLILTKGAPEAILGRCTHYWDFRSNTSVPINDQFSETFSNHIQKYANEGYRTLGFASKEVSADSLPKPNDLVKDTSIEQGLCLYGLCAVQDPPRPTVKQAIQECHNAGVDVIMITGDHPATATAIAKAIELIPSNLSSSDAKALVSTNTESLTDEQILQKKVFARATPDDKLRIIEAYQTKGLIAAMTGDGINDALALEKADTGIAMGIKGTDVAKSAADIILADDSFITITEAIYHGRGLFNNIRKNLLFTIAINTMEALTLSAAFLLWDAVQVFQGAQLGIFLWFVVHTFPTFALLFDPYNREELLSQKPIPPNESILNKNFRTFLLMKVSSVMVILLLVFWMTLQQVGPFILNNANIQDAAVIYQFPTGNIAYGDLTTQQVIQVKASTICLVIVTFSEIWTALSVRSEKKSVFKTQHNYPLYGFLIALVCVLIFIISTKWGQGYFLVLPLSASDWILAFGISLITLGIDELYKAMLR
jgi:Ca2+-transporting ATPase